MCLGIPGRVVALDEHDPMLATVDVAGVRRQVNITCVVSDDHPPQACIGEWVLIHVGFAMMRIDEAEAQRTLDVLTALGDAHDELQAMREGT